jgi:hypothetical protein
VSDRIADHSFTCKNIETVFHCSAKREQYNHVYQKMKPVGMKEAVGYHPVQLIFVIYLIGIQLQSPEKIVIPES